MSTSTLLIDDQKAVKPSPKSSLGLFQARANQTRTNLLNAVASARLPKEEAGYQHVQQLLGHKLKRLDLSSTKVVRTLPALKLPQKPSSNWQRQLPQVTAVMARTKVYAAGFQAVDKVVGTAIHAVGQVVQFVAKRHPVAAAVKDEVVDVAKSAVGMGLFLYQKSPLPPIVEKLFRKHHEGNIAYFNYLLRQGVNQKAAQEHIANGNYLFMQYIFAGLGAIPLTLCAKPIVKAAKAVKDVAKDSLFLQLGREQFAIYWHEGRSALGYVSHPNHAEPRILTSGFDRGKRIGYFESGGKELQVPDNIPYGFFDRGPGYDWTDAAKELFFLQNNVRLTETVSTFTPQGRFFMEYPQGSVVDVTLLKMGNLELTVESSTIPALQIRVDHLHQFEQLHLLGIQTPHLVAAAKTLDGGFLFLEEISGTNFGRLLNGGANQAHVKWLENGLKRLGRGLAELHDHHVDCLWVAPWKEILHKELYHNEQRFLSALNLLPKKVRKQALGEFFPDDRQIESLLRIVETELNSAPASYVIRRNELGNFALNAEGVVSYRGFRGLGPGLAPLDAHLVEKSIVRDGILHGFSQEQALQFAACFADEYLRAGGRIGQGSPIERVSRMIANYTRMAELLEGGAKQKTKIDPELLMKAMKEINEDLL